MPFHLKFTIEQKREGEKEKWCVSVYITHLYDFFFLALPCCHRHITLICCWAHLSIWFYSYIVFGYISMEFRWFLIFLSWRFFWWVNVSVCRWYVFASFVSRQRESKRKIYIGNFTEALSSNVHFNFGDKLLLQFETYIRNALAQGCCKQ